MVPSLTNIQDWSDVKFKLSFMYPLVTNCKSSEAGVSRAFMYPFLNNSKILNLTLDSAKSGAS